MIRAASRAVGFALLSFCLSTVSVAQSFGPVSPVFDAASVHRVDPNERVPGISQRGGPETSSPNLYTCKYCTIAMFVQLGYDLQPYQVIIPDDVRDEHYMVSAKVPPGTSKSEFRRMMQRFLSDHFNLTFHTVSRPLDGYALTADKRGTKLKVAEIDDSNDQDVPQATPNIDGFKIGDDGFPILPSGTRLSIVSAKGAMRISAKRESMAGLAELLSRQFAKPVEDRTMLNGSYDITLTWATDGLSAKPSEFSQWPPLEDAVTAQLGLRLEKVNLPVKMYVVDMVVRTPGN